jgi:hypothetical protein
MWGREKIGKTVEEIADHLLLVDHVKALQQGQKEIAEALKAVNDRLTAMEAEFKVLKAETQRDALREVQQAVNAVQGAFYEKLGSLSTRVTLAEQAIRHDERAVRPTISLSDNSIRTSDGSHSADGPQ